MRRIEPGDDWTAMLAGLHGRRRSGSAPINPALATAAIGVVEPHRSGMASGINSTFRQVGIATGTAALGAVFTHVVNGQATAFGAALARADVETGGDTRSGQFSDFISFGGFRQVGGGQAVTLAGQSAFLEGLHRILLYGGITALVSAVLCALLIRPSGFVAREAARPAGGRRPRPDRPASARGAA